MHIDLRTTALASRWAGADFASRVAGDVTESLELLVLDFGDKIATASWLDAFFVALFKYIADASLSTRLVAISSSEDNREHISLVLDKRGYAILATDSIESLASGSLYALGRVSEASTEVIKTIHRVGDVSVQDLASALDLTVEAAQLRLTPLLELRLLDRFKQGRHYVYRLPALQVDKVLVPA